MKYITITVLLQNDERERNYDMNSIRGYRARIGLIYIASAYAMDVEFQMMAPAGVTTHTTRVKLSDDPSHFTAEDLIALEGRTLEATDIIAQAPLQAIAFGCTSGSFVNGPAYDQKLRDQMTEIAKIPCTTTSHAVVQALQVLQVKKIAIATPYTEEVNKRAATYFAAHDFQITNLSGLGLMNDYHISKVDDETVYQMAKQVDTEDAEAIFISCTGLHTTPIIQYLENDLGKPVITSNQATFWHTLRLSGIQDELTKFGSLFQY